MLAAKLLELAALEDRSRLPVPRLGDGALAPKQLDDDDDDDDMDNFGGFEQVNDANVGKIAHAIPGNHIDKVPVKKN